jgi:hypothetical protein
MKISKSLLQAILVGITVGTTAPSCEKMDKEDELMQLESREQHENQNGENQNWDNCPACGMG